MDINLADYESGYQVDKYSEQEIPVSVVNSEETAAPNPIFRKIGRWLVYAAAFLTPLWFLPFTADVLEFNKQILLIAIAGVGLVVWLIDMIKSGVIKYRPSPFYFPVLGIIAAGIMAVIFSVSRTVSIFGAADSRNSSLVSLVALAVLFGLALNVIEDRGRALRKIMTVSLALSFVFGALQMLGLHLFGGSLLASRSFNSIGGLNSLGILAAATLPLFASAIFAESGKSQLVIGWQDRVADAARYIGLALVLFFVVLANWWPVWAVAFVSLIALAAFMSAGDPSLFRKGRMRLFAIPMAVIVLGIFMMLVNFNWVSIKSKLPIEVLPSQKTSWSIVLDSLKARPLGYGLENFGLAYDKFKPASIANSIFYQIGFSDSASEIINLAVGGGILMLAAFLSLFWFYARSLWRGVKNGFSGVTDSVAGWAAGLGVIATLFLFPSNLTIFSVFFLFLVLVALSETRPDEERVLNLESDAKYSFAGSVIFIIGLAMVLVADYFSVNNYIADIYLAKAVQETKPNKAIEYFVASANANGQDARTYRLLSQTVLAQLVEDLKAGPKKDETKENYNARVQNEIASAVNISVRATNVEPADAQNWANRGWIYQNMINFVGGADQAAINSYNESLARNSNDPTSYFRIGSVYFMLADSIQKAINEGRAGDITVARQKINDNLAKSEDNFGKAIALYGNYGQALYNLAAVYDRQGKLPEAIKQFEKLQTANSRDPSIVFQLGLLYYRNNQKDNALRAWQQAVFLFPNYSNARWYLSLIYEERGDLAQALEQVREIEKLNPDNELVKQRLAQLEAGKRTIPPEKVLDKKPL